MIQPESREETTFGKWLRKRRRALDLTQKELSNRVGCARITLRRIESDALKPSSELAEIILENLDIPETELPQWIKFARGVTGYPSKSTPAQKPSITNLPSGIVTFLFTDIEGSTKIAQAHPDQWEMMRERHHAILISAIEANNGYVFQVIGDAFCAAFHKTTDAFQASIKSQIDLHNETWGEMPIKVRMGIHTGRAELQDEGQYQGYSVLSRVQRIMSAGHGGQTLISSATQELVRDELPKGISLQDLGEKRLKDMILSEHIYQLIIPNLPSEFPPIRAEEIVLHNLPTQLTSFIGRQKETADILNLISKHRLVTLAGTGGVGKTRLSIKVGKELLKEYSNGVWLLELASLQDPELLPQTTAVLFGISKQANLPFIDLLIKIIGSKTTLLIMDNCEHLLDACAHLADILLKHCPELKIIATSREPLEIMGEAVYLVPSLQLPDADHMLDKLRGYESIHLFEERAQLARTDFSLTMKNASSVVHICQRLDGIPLAIELAAAKTGVLSTQQIADQLDQNFKLLTGGNRTALPHQQTIRASIDWSWNLLSEEERKFMRRLSVFAGGWTLEAAEAVCGSNAIELTSHLAAKSLITKTRGLGDETRFRFHEMIGRYAHEKLVEAEEEVEIRNQHMAYFIDLAERANPELIRSNQLQWFNNLNDEFDNLRAVLKWAIKNNDKKAGMQLMVSSEAFWKSRGDPREIGEWLKQLLEGWNENNSLRAHALLFYGQVMGTQNNMAQAQEFYEQSLQLARALSNKDEEAFSLLAVSDILASRGNFKDGIPMKEQSLDLFRELGNKYGQATAMFNLGGFETDLKKSISLLLESLKLYRELGDLANTAFVLVELAIRSIWLKEFSNPPNWLEEAHAIFQHLEINHGEANVMLGYGHLAYEQGNYQQARDYYEESILLFEKAGFVQIWRYLDVAFSILLGGDPIQAFPIFKSCIKDFQNNQDRIGLICSLEGLAIISYKLEQFERAGILIGWVDTTRKNVGRPDHDRIDEVTTVCTTELGEKMFSKAYDAGSKMSMDEAVIFALDES